jgi:hypothetical protein
MLAAGMVACIGSFATAWSGAAGAEAPADLVVLDANVLTIVDASPQAEAFAVRDGRFVAVGKSSDMERYIGPKTQILHLKGKTVTPGFNDAHLHPSAAYAEDDPRYVVPLGPDHVKTMDDLIAALKRQADKTPKGQTVRGAAYDDAKLGRHPTCHDLDRASTDHPIVIHQVSGGHLTVCNTYALKAAGITRDTPSPRGGEIGKDANGEPNGYLAESAGGLVSGVGARPSAPSTTDREKGLLVCLQKYAAKGITSAGVAGTSVGGLREYETMRDKGTLPVRMNVMLSSGNVSRLTELMKTAPKDNLVRIGTIKIYHGNSLSGRTCWVTDPYVDRPNYYGVAPSRSQERLDELVWSIHSAGLQVACHSNGDKEIDMLLTAFEHAQARMPRPDARHRIEHCSIVTQALLDRIKKDGIVIVPHSYEWEHGDKFSSYGEKRWEWMFPNKRAIDMGIPVAGHSDSPISAADPMLRVQCLVTRTSAEGVVIAASQQMSAEAALRIWTVGGAYATSEEKIKGTIAPGMLADFAVLSADPTKTPGLKIKDIVVERTIMGGKTVYQRTADAARLSLYAPGSYHICCDGDEADEACEWPDPATDYERLR